MRVTGMCLVLAVAVVVAGQAQAAITTITQSGFSGSESLITFSRVTDTRSGDPITVGGVSFDNAPGKGNLMSGGDRALFFGKLSDDGQLIDLVPQSNFSIIFPNAVNRVGMVLASGGWELGRPIVTWSFEAYGTDNTTLLGTGSVGGTKTDMLNGGSYSWLAFMGFESTVDIGRVRVFQTANDANITIMDDLRFEAVAPGSNTSVPEPATMIVWSVLGLTAVGFSFWRRK